MALSLYRKYRPNTFADVVGQEHVERTLENAVAEGTVAHAYLFCGPRGTGKTTSARLLAKALLCQGADGARPDGTCPECVEIAEGAHPDVYELDAASRTGVENVREEIIGRVQFAPTRGRYKVYIIDEVHMLTTQAFNALLKTLEEPPAHIVFVMCTTDPHKVPETIQSRCQRFDFRRFSIDEIVGYLKRICAGEGFTAEDAALEFMAAKSNGGMRDATTSLEQVAVFNQGAITLNAARGILGQMDVSGLFEVGSCIAARDTAACFKWIDRLVASGIDLSQCAHDLAAHMRDLYATALTGGADGIVACPSSELPRYQEQARCFGGAERLGRALTTCGDLERELRNSTDARLSFEIALVRLCRAESELTLESLAERVESLEQGIPAPKMVAAYAPAPAKAVAEPEPAPQRAAVIEPEPQPETAADLPWDEEPVIADPVSTQPTMGAGLLQEEPEPAGAWPQTDVVAASTPVSEPDPQPQADTANMSPARVLAAVLTEVKRNDVATAALLNGVSLEHDDQGYHLVFPESGTFAMKLARSGDTAKLLKQAFASVTGSPEFSCKMAGSAAAPQKVQPASFGSVSATEAAAPSTFSDDGYDAAQDAYADYAAFGYDDAEPVTAGGPSFEPAYAPPMDDDPYAALSGKATPAVDQATASELADTLSVFGGGIRFEEVD